MTFGGWHYIKKSDLDTDLLISLLEDWFCEYMVVEKPADTTYVLTKIILDARHGWHRKADGSERKTDESFD